MDSNENKSNKRNFDLISKDNEKKANNESINRTKITENKNKQTQSDAIVGKWVTYVSLPSKRREIIFLSIKLSLY